MTLEALKEIKCVVRDFTPDDIATYDNIASFLAERKITATKVDVRKVLHDFQAKGGVGTVGDPDEAPDCASVTESGRVLCSCW